MPDPLKRDPAGFRLRGLSTTRIATFIEAAFAFALVASLLKGEKAGAGNSEVS